MNRVVVTGMGVVAPNGINIPAFTHALQHGVTGLHFIPQMHDWNMGCTVAGYPKNFDDIVLAPYLSAGALRGLKSTSVKYAIAAAMEAWKDAGLTTNRQETDWDTGCIIGASVCDVDHMNFAIKEMEAIRGPQLGLRHVDQLMSSGSSAYVAGLLGLGNRVYSNSSACSTGTESIIMAYEHIKNGNAKRMVAGSTEASSAYMWSVFDAMRVCNRNHNDNPAAASRPMNTDSAGFIPGSGAGILILETMEAALERGATIYAEIVGGYLNSGGQRNGGTMTAPAPEGVIACIQKTLEVANTDANDIDLVCGHLTGTFADKLEIINWATALNRKGKDFPYINTVKSMIGHCISAAGAIESIAAILQLQHKFIHPNLNCTPVQPEILEWIDDSCIVKETQPLAIRTVIKANFGFGDVNSCIIFKN